MKSHALRGINYQFGEKKMKSIVLTAFAALAICVGGCENSVYDEQADAIRDSTQMEADAIRERSDAQADRVREDAAITGNQIDQTDPTGASYDRADATEDVGEIRADKIEEEGEVKADLIESQGEAKADAVEELD